MKEAPLRARWRQQPTEPIDARRLRELRARGDRLAKKTTQRNSSETIAGLFAMAFFAYAALQASGLLERAAWSLTALGGAVVLGILWRRGRMRPSPALNEPSSVYLAYLRAELVRERDLLASAWLWYVGPIVPGMVLGFFAVSRRAPLAWSAITLIIVLALFGLVGWLNKRAAAKLDQEIAAL